MDCQYKVRCYKQALYFNPIFIITYIERLFLLELRPGE